MTLRIVRNVRFRGQSAGLRGIRGVRGAWFPTSTLSGLMTDFLGWSQHRAQLEAELLAEFEATRRADPDGAEGWLATHSLSLGHRPLIDAPPTVDADGVQWMHQAADAIGRGEP